MVRYLRNSFYVLCTVLIFTLCLHIWIDCKYDKSYHRTIPICTNAERVSLLLNQCKNSNNHPQNVSYQELGTVYENLFVDHQHKLVACLPPKTGSTTWKAILANNSLESGLDKGYTIKSLHVDSVLEYYKIYRMSTLTRRKIQEVIESYYKILVVRHPLDRLQSAYVDKLQSGADPEWKDMLENRIHKHQNTTSNQDIHFNHFIKYIKDTKFYNKHWNSFLNLCQPCFIKYDRILKMESLERDNEYVINQVLKPLSRGTGVKENVVMSRSNNNYILTQHGKVLKHFVNLTQDDISFILDFYRLDMDLFGYSSKTVYEPSQSVFAHCKKGSVDKICC